MRLLSELTEKQAREYFEKSDLVIVLVGAIAPHGTVNPLGSDLFHVQEVGKRVSDKTGILLVDAVPFGESEYWRGFPGTISLKPSTIENVYFDIAECLKEHGVRKVIFLNGHGGTERTLAAVAMKMRVKLNMLAALIDWWRLPSRLDLEAFGKMPGGHALMSETSYNLAIRPDLVHLDEPVKHKSLNQLGGTDEIKFVHPCSATYKGVSVRIMNRTADFTDLASFRSRGPEVDWSKATAEYGERSINAVVDWLVGFIEEFKKLNMTPEI